MHTLEALSAAELNADQGTTRLDRAALDRAIGEQGLTWQSLVAGRTLFADAPVFVSAAQMQQMREVIEAVERVVHQRQTLSPGAAKGVFFWL